MAVAVAVAGLFEADGEEGGQGKNLLREKRVPRILVAVGSLGGAHRPGQTQASNQLDQLTG